MTDEKSDWYTLVGAVVVAATVIFCLCYFSDTNYKMNHPSLSNVTFELLNKDANSNEVLIGDGSTLLFEHGSDLSQVAFKEQWESLKVGNNYTCDKKTFTCVFPQTCTLVYPHITNCIEV